MIHKYFKYRIYPTKEQQKFLANQFGGVRFVYNFFLANRKSEYLNNKTSLNYYDDAKLLTSLKQQDGYVWMQEMITQSLQASLRNLEVAYNNFFRKLAKFPKFHKKSNKQSIKFPQNFAVEEDKLYIPKLKSSIKINKHSPTEGKIKSITLSKTPTNKYYVSVLCEIENIKQLPKNNNIIGIDLGIKDLIITSNRDRIENKKFSKQNEKKLAYEQRQLSKKKPGGKNKEKQRKKVAAIYEYISNCRIDYLHKTTKRLIDENQVIIAESLSVVKMMKDSYLAKDIADASWRELLKQLEYKAKWYGRTFYQIDQFFPSSKTCNSCRFILNDLPLNIRKWTCPSCHHCHDRDVNGALNIRDKGINDLIQLGAMSKDLNLSGFGMKSDIKQKLVERLALADAMKQDVVNVS